MKNKYNLTIKQNIFLAKRLYEDIIQCGMNLRGTKITFSQMQTVLYGVNRNDVKPEDVETILCMKNAWWYILNTINEPMTLEHISKVNDLVVGRKDSITGNLNKYNRCFNGKIYRRFNLDKKIMINEIENMIKKNCVNTEKALEFFIWGMTNKLFNSENNTTILMIANKILISEGNGLFVISDNNIKKINKLLNQDCNSNEYDRLITLLYQTSIKGIDF